MKRKYQCFGDLFSARWLRLFSNSCLIRSDISTELPCSDNKVFIRKRLYFDLTSSTKFLSSTL